MNNKEKVAIVVLNYNQFESTIACIKSIFEMDYDNFSLVIVDNDSSNNSFNKIKFFLEEKFSKYEEPIIKTDNADKIIHYQYHDTSIYLASSQKNGGYSYGNNIGIKISMKLLNPEFIWILNNDILVANNSLDLLVDKFKAKEGISGDIGILGSNLVFPDLTIQATYGKFNKFTGKVKEIKESIQDRIHDLIEVDYAIGASLLFRPQLINKIGYFDETYFLYFEELDISIRARNNNLKTFVAPDVFLIHKQGTSTKLGEKFKKSNISYIHEIIKYKSFISLYKNHFKSFLYISYFRLFIKALYCALSGRYTDSSIIIKAIFIKNIKKQDK